MYYAFEVTEKLRKEILQQYPAKFPETICHHSTLVFSNINDTTYQLDTPYTMRVWYTLSSDNIQCAVVSIDTTFVRPDGNNFHITISLDRDKGAKPAHSNLVIAKFMRDDDSKIIAYEAVDQDVPTDIVFLKKYD